MGKALAELVTEGEAEVDVQPYRPWRFGGPYRDADFAAATAREVYKYYYRLRYPLDVSQAGRPSRLSPLHERLEALGAVFGTKNGWERAEYFRPGEPPRRAGEDQRTVGWTRPPWYDRVAVEHHAIRDRLGIVDMTSFGKLETRVTSTCSSASATTGSTGRWARSCTRSSSTSAAASSAT